MADKDIEIAMKTTGDTSGAEKVSASVEDIKRVTAEAADASAKAGDDQEKAARRLAFELRRLEIQTSGLKTESSSGFGGMLDAPAVEKLTEAQKKLVTKFKEGKTALDELGVSASLNKEIPGGGILEKTLGLLGRYPGVAAAAAAGGGVLIERFKQISDAINSIDEKQLAKLSPALAKEAEEFKKAAEFFTAPIDAIQRAISGTTISEAYESLNEQLKLNADAAVTNFDRVHGVRLRQLTAEGVKLQEQAVEYERLITLQNALNQQKVTSANQNVTLTELKGGDVAQAKVQAIAASFQADVEELNSTITSARNNLSEAINAELVAITTLKNETRKVAQGVITQEEAGIDELKENARALGVATETARKDLTGTVEKFGGANKNIVEKAEIELATVENEAGDKITKGAKALADGLDQKLREQVAKAPEEALGAVNKINADVGAITTAATEKSTEIKNSIAAERTETVTAIQNLTPTPQDTAAIVSAVKQVSEAQAARDNAIIAVLVETAAGINRMIARVNNQQAQIATLFSRIR